jgi:hypothetical protein
VRLCSRKLEEKNRALTEAHAQVSEALEQQTATAEILRVISSSPTDVQPVFDTIVSSAVRLCDGLFGALYRFDGELLHLVAHYNYTPEALEAAHRVFPGRPSRGGGPGRAILDRAVAHIPTSSSIWSTDIQRWRARSGGEAVSSFQCCGRALPSASSR